MGLKNIRNFRNALRKLERALDDQLQAGTECCGISLVQCHTLMELDKQEETNLKALSQALELDKSTVSRGIDLLVKSGLVDRKTDSNNRRFVLLSLSGKGKDVCCTINNFCDRYYQDIFTHIPKEKHGQVMESLILLANALSIVKKEKSIARMQPMPL